MSTVITDVSKGINNPVMVCKPQAGGSNKKIDTVGFQAIGTWTGDLKLKRSINGNDFNYVKDADGNDVIFSPANPFIDIIPTESFFIVDISSVTSTDLIVEVSI